MRAPAYQMYGSDFELDTAHMSCEEVGAYVRLLNFQWKRGAVPSELDRMAKVCRLSATRMQRLWPALEEHFPASDDGQLRNPRMEKVRAAQVEFKEHMKEISERGVEARRRNRTVDRTVDQPVYQDPGTPLLLRSPTPSPSGPLSDLGHTPPSGLTTRAPGGVCLSENYPTPELAEAGFRAFLRIYPPDGVPNPVEAERAWSQMLPALPALAVLSASVERCKRSELWRSGKVHHVHNFLRNRMWEGRLGEGGRAGRRSAGFEPSDLTGDQPPFDPEAPHA